MRLFVWVALLSWAAPAASQDYGLGAQLFERCAMCHEIGEGAQNRQGPQLNALFGRRAASLADFPYSTALREAGDQGLTWTPETVAAFIANPRHFEPGTGMIFPGLKNPADVDDVVAYLLGLEAAASEQIQLGQMLVEMNCGGCHSTAREGESPHNEAPPFRLLGERYDIADLSEALVEGLVSGHPDMPEFTFEPDEAEVIIAFLESLRSTADGGDPVE
jgi:cytochrome c